MLFIDFISFSGGTYMLATPAREAHDFYQGSVIAKSNHKRPDVDVYLLKVVSDGEIPMVCHFKHRQKHGSEEQKGKRRR
jgi:hypothetical protein